MPTNLRKKATSRQNKSKMSQNEHVSQYCRCDSVFHWLVVLCSSGSYKHFLSKSTHFGTLDLNKTLFSEEPFKLFRFVAFLLFSSLFHPTMTFFFANIFCTYLAIFHSNFLEILAFGERLRNFLIALPELVAKLKIIHTILVHFAALLFQSLKNAFFKINIKPIKENKRIIFSCKKWSLEKLRN